MTEPKLVDKIGNFGWAIAVIAALAMSFWSLTWLAHFELHAPIYIAPLAPLAFDGGAITASVLTLKWAKVHGVSGLSARIATLTFAGASAWFNYQHAILANQGRIAGYFYALPPIIAVTILELHLRFEHRAALKRAGNLPESPPTYHKWAWLLFPIHTLVTLRKNVRLSIDKTDPEFNGTMWNSEIDHAIIRDWANSRGIDVPKRGRVPGNVIEMWHAELPAGNGHERAS